MSETSNLPAVQTNLTQWPSFVEDQQELAELMREIIGPQKNMDFALTLPRIKTPSGENTLWMVRNPETGRDKGVEAIEGVLIYQDLQRAYYKEPYEKTGGGLPPDCYSVDMEHGIGDPGVECVTCVFNKFDSAIDKTTGQPGAPGKGCPEIRRLFILTPEYPLPYLILAKPGSSARGTPLYDYLIRDTLMMRYWKVITSFELHTTMAKQRRIDYAQIVPRLVRRLDPEEISYVEQMRAMVRRMVTGVPSVVEALDDEDDLD